MARSRWVLPVLEHCYSMQRSALDAEVRRSVNEKLEKSGEKERYVVATLTFFSGCAKSEVSHLRMHESG
jgi:hypothetical protein